MPCRLQELRKKEVINAHTGARIGFVDDLEVDTKCAMVVALIVYGRPRFFGLFGRESDYVLPWSSIKQMGGAIILIDGKADIRRQSAERGGIL